MKKQDILLISVLLVAAVLIYFFINYFYAEDGAMVQVSVDGEVVAEYDLYEDGEYTIETDEGYNILTIEDGEASISEADCPDQICVNESAISKVGESIICLPHKVVITIVGDDAEEAETDAFAS